MIVLATACTWQVNDWSHRQERKKTQICRNHFLFSISDWELVTKNRRFLQDKSRTDWPNAYLCGILLHLCCLESLFQFGTDIKRFFFRHIVYWFIFSFGLVCILWEMIFVELSVLCIGRYDDGSLLLCCWCHSPMRRDLLLLLKVGCHQNDQQQWPERSQIGILKIWRIWRIVWNHHHHHHPLIGLDWAVRLIDSGLLSSITDQIICHQGNPIAPIAPYCKINSDASRNS